MDKESKQAYTFIEHDCYDNKVYGTNEKYTCEKCVICDKILKFEWRERKARGFEEVIKKHKKHDSKTILPVRGSKYSAGYDFHSKEDVIIEPGKSHLFWTDVKAYMQEGEVLEIYVRSSIGIKKNLILKNLVGIIDMDYFCNENNDGNIGVCLFNIGEEEQHIKCGERIAQGIFKNFLVADNKEDNLKERKGGIGHTGE